MRRTLILLATLGVTLIAAPTIEAQAPSGTYETVVVEGKPIPDDIEVTRKFYRDANGTLTGDTYADPGDGRGPRLIRRERSTYHELGLSGIYEWTNASGTFGLLYYSDTREQWESIVLTGPNAGRIVGYSR